MNNNYVYTLSVALSFLISTSAMAKEDPVGTGTNPDAPRSCNTMRRHEDNKVMTERVTQLKKQLALAESNAQKTLVCKNYINDRWSDLSSRPGGHRHYHWTNIMDPHPESQDPGNSGAPNYYSNSCTQSGLSWQSSIAYSIYGFGQPVQMRHSQSCNDRTSIRLSTSTLFQASSLSGQIINYNAIDQISTGTKPVGLSYHYLGGAAIYDRDRNDPNRIQSGVQNNIVEAPAGVSILPSGWVKVEDWSCMIQATNAREAFENFFSAITDILIPYCADDEWDDALDELESQARALEEKLSAPDIRFQPGEADCRLFGLREIKNAFSNYDYRPLTSCSR